MASLSSILREIEIIDRRLRALESINQVKTLYFGRIFLDGENGKIIVTDASSNQRIIINQADNSIVVKNAAGTEIIRLDSTGLFFKGQLVNSNAEIHMPVTLEHWFTGVGTYEKQSGTSFLLNGNNFNNQNVYFEMNMLVEQSGRTAYARIYNETDGVALAGSEITSTLVGSYDVGRGIYTTWDTIRSGALTLAAGQKKYAIQVKQSPAGDGGDKAHYFTGRLVLVQQ